MSTHLQLEAIRDGASRTDDRRFFIGLPSLRLLPLPSSASSVSSIISCTRVLALQTSL